MGGSLKFDCGVGLKSIHGRGGLKILVKNTCGGVHCLWSGVVFQMVRWGRASFLSRRGCPLGECRF